MQPPPLPLRNIGIVAHVDAGKTTLTENLLYHTGGIRSLGSVDKGTAHTDFLDIERERGISVRAASTTIRWRETDINLIDTPGHMDFTAEVERSLRVLDGAVLVVSAVEGVQAQTEIIWRAMRKRQLPTLIFVNKLDRIGADPERVLAEIHRLLSPQVLPIQTVTGMETGEPAVLNRFDPDVPENRFPFGRFPEAWLERLCEGDDALLANWLDGEHLSPDRLYDSLRKQSTSNALYPVLYGAALKELGTFALLDAIVDLLPAPQGSASLPLSGVVFRLEHDKTMGRVAHVRLYGGTLENRDVVDNVTRGTQEKVTQIRKTLANRHLDTGRLSAGDIAAVYGLSQARIGDILGNAAGIPEATGMAVPLLLVQVHPHTEAELPAVVAALQELSDEDPLLGLEWVRETRQIHVKIMGTIQLEVLGSLLRSRFGLTVGFGSPVVLYKETPAKAATGYISYTMPKPCWAILEFYLKPLPRGSGVKTGGWVREEKLHQRYQHQVWQTLPDALRQGLYGWEVTDLEVTLLGGEHHIFHTHPLDFVTATPMGILNGLANAGTRLLEPMLHCRITAPDTVSSRILGDIVNMRGTFDAPVIQQGRFEVEARLPVSTSMDYSVRLGALTGGRGHMTTRFDGYEPCPLELGATTPYRGVNPLDQAKYILSVRKALGG
jgi:ribosomal protection tetracycline resistance protein